ncbi:MAG TPA: glycosyltransferase family 2 protein [Actinobacteria bacterium]|nr:glycosyltransferase family 2 protein [Actinomycetota bacterium]
MKDKMNKEKITDVSIVIPTYNEGKNILSSLKDLKNVMDNSSYSYEVIVVDDGSTDNTVKLLEPLSWIRLFKRPINMGTGAARKYGTLRAHGKYVVWTDADDCLPHDVIPEFVKELDENEEYDQVVAARTSEQGNIKFLRVPMKWLIRKLAIYLTEQEIPDLNCGLRAFRRNIGFKYLYLLPKGFSCVTTMTLAFLINGHPIKFYPIEYKKRVHGKSKFRPIKDTARYLLQVIKMVMYFDPLKIFLPIVVVLMLISIGKLGYDISTRGFSIPGSTIVVLMVSFQTLVIGLLADLIVGMSRKE